MEGQCHGLAEILDRGDLVEDLLQPGGLGQGTRTLGVRGGDSSAPLLIADEPIEALGLEGEKVGSLHGLGDLRKIDTPRRGSRGDVSGSRCVGARGSQRGSFPHLGDHSALTAVRAGRASWREPDGRRRESTSATDASTHNGRKALAYTSDIPRTMPVRHWFLRFTPQSRILPHSTSRPRPVPGTTAPRPPDGWAGRRPAGLPDPPAVHPIGCTADRRRTEPGGLTRG